LAVRAVIDTNLIISYLLTQGDTISQLIDLWEADYFVYVTSNEILREMEDVLNRPQLLRYMKENPEVMLESIKNDALIIPGEVVLTGVCRDPKDDKFIACAIEGNADFIVTGDKDLLDLTVYQDVKMIRAYDFVRLLLD
jgi:putative PIN family toxin of toxin-antitoxin system